MDYQVVLAESAKADADHLYRWATAGAPLRGPAWFDALVEHLYTLERMPRRCPLAREARGMGREIRCLSFGRRRNVYRILYEIDEQRKIVHVLRIRHGSLRDLTVDQL